MRYVPLKTMEQLELQALHRVRRRFIVERTAAINQELPRLETVRPKWAFTVDQAISLF